MKPSLVSSISDDRRIRQVRKSLNDKFLHTLLEALVLSRLDYCNSVLLYSPCIHLSTAYHRSSLCWKTHWKFDSTWSCHPTLREVHWLPMQARINFKIWFPMHRVQLTCFLCFLTCYTLFISPIQTCCTILISKTQTDFVVTRSFRKSENRTFALAWPAEWNKLPDFIRKSSTLSLFKN